MKYHFSSNFIIMTMNQIYVHQTLIVLSLFDVIETHTHNNWGMSRRTAHTKTQFDQSFKPNTRKLELSLACLNWITFNSIRWEIIKFEKYWWSQLLVKPLSLTLSLSVFNCSRWLDYFLTQRIANFEMRPNTKRTRIKQ